MDDLYAKLGLTRRASSDEIRAAYRVLAKRYHPDVNSSDEQSERLTKEINRAYAILGHIEARAAYDRHLEQKRTAARRRFWRSAATGIATFIMTVSSVWLASMWTQIPSIHKSQKKEPTVLLAHEAKPSPAEVVDARGPAASGHLDSRDTTREPVIASVPGAFAQPPSPATEERQGAPPSERAPAREKIASGPIADPTQSLERPVITSAPANNTPSRTEVATQGPPEASMKQSIRVPAVTLPSRKSNQRNDIGKTALIGFKKLSPQFNATEQGSDREPHIAARSATALRWPTADEPFVNLGGRSR